MKKNNKKEEEYEDIEKDFFVNEASRQFFEDFKEILDGHVAEIEKNLKSSK